MRANLMSRRFVSMLPRHDHKKKVHEIGGEFWAVPGSALNISASLL